LQPGSKETGEKVWIETGVAQRGGTTYRKFFDAMAPREKKRIVKNFLEIQEGEHKKTARNQEKQK
jgi:hypothetical protein